MGFEGAMQCLNDKRWDDLKQLNLPAHFRSTESRTDMEIKLLSEISKILSTNPPRETEIIFLKTLINSCCQVFDSNSVRDETLGSITNQVPYEEAIRHTTEKIIKISETISEPEDELILKLYLKFICNFLTLLCQTSKNPSFESVPACLKNSTLKTSIINLTQHSSEEVATISCIFCYNALTELLEKDYFNFEEQLDLLNRFIKSYTKIGCSAAEEGIVHMITIPTIFTNFYKCSNLSEKKVLMEITRKHFDKEKKCTVPTESVLFLTQRFNKITDKVTLTNNIQNLQPDEPEELSSLLDLLLHMCSCDLEFLRFVQKNKSFLINCVGLLKMLHLTGKSKDSFFTPVDYTKEMMMASKSDDEDKSAFEDFGEFNAMVYGFKSKLVRTIGNLSHLNKENQDLIREMEGLSVIMDCCILDAKNPLIKECAIYAIRNLCENNLENQEQIHKTVKMETDSTQLLEKMGLTLQDNEDGGGIRIAPIKRK